MPPPLNVLNTIEPLLSPPRPSSAQPASTAAAPAAPLPKPPPAHLYPQASAPSALRVPTSPISSPPTVPNQTSSPLSSNPLAALLSTERVPILANKSADSNVHLLATPDGYPSGAKSADSGRGWNGVNVKADWAPRDRREGGDAAAAADGGRANEPSGPDSVDNGFGFEDSALMRNLASLLHDEPDFLSADAKR